ncbi:hypothetical protein MTO96_016382 [Rhipicephalus appendiculatus]
MSKMLKVLRPTSKVLVDCAADVIITYRANASLLAKPGFEKVEGTEGMKIFKKMMACFCDNKDLEFEDSGQTSAVMHWLYEVLRPDARTND